MVRLIMNLFSDIKRLYFQAGVENKPTVFLFVDTQVQEESFLEDINNVLSSGEVPNLYKPDEFEEVSFTSLSKWEITLFFYEKFTRTMFPIKFRKRCPSLFVNEE